MGNMTGLAGGKDFGAESTNKRLDTNHKRRKKEKSKAMTFTK